jgi:hypothetical protein
MAISAHNPTSARKSRVRTPSLTIIEFVLDQLPNVGTAGQLLHLSLAQNYMVVPDKLHHELIFFNINDDQVEKHTKRMAKIVKELRKGYLFFAAISPPGSQVHYRGFDHALVIVHTHSDDTSGDLWYCSRDEEAGGSAAMPIGDVCIFFPTPTGFNSFSSSSMQSLALRW